MKKHYIVASRASKLALTQTNLVIKSLQEIHNDLTFEVQTFSTQGDRVIDKPLSAFESTGVFVKELENALLEGKADFAVHSLKDMPSILPEGLILASFPKREDVRDVLLIRNGEDLATLPENCVIGTGSPRRIVQIRELKPKAIFKEIRGNIDTRIKKIYEGQYDAIVLAAAGLIRLGIQINENQLLSIEQCLPAIGQAALGIECRANDLDTIQVLRTINHNPTEIAVTAERSFMKTMGAGCKMPMAAYAIVDNQQISLEVMLNTTKIKDTDSIENAELLGIRLANRLKNNDSFVSL